MNPYAVDPAKVVQLLLDAGGEAALHARLAMHAVALEDARAALAERDARIAQLEGDEPTE